MAYDKGYVAIYNYLKENGAVDFDPLPQRAAAPPPPRASTSGSGGSGGSGGSSGADAAAAIAKSLGDGFKSPLESGVYRVSGAAEKMSITTMAKSGAVTYTDAGGKQSSGNLSIDGTRLIINLGGRTYIYTITSSTSFSNNGETWVRTGY
jgi:hypothetical protein